MWMLLCNGRVVVLADVSEVVCGRGHGEICIGWVWEMVCGVCGGGGRGGGRLKERER